jgi:MFS family permease
VVGVIAFAAVGGFLFGYDTGVVGGAILLIQEQFNLSSLLVETVISIALVGIFASCRAALMAVMTSRANLISITTPRRHHRLGKWWSPLRLARTKEGYVSASCECWLSKLYG